MSKGKHNIRISVQPAKTNEQLKKDLRNSAERYSSYVDKKILFVYRENRDGAPYECYEVFYGKENFIHLAGFKRLPEFNSSSAESFYKHCLAGTIKIKKFRFSDSRQSASGKLDVLPDLLDYKNAKIYKIGDADLISLKNKFEIAIGSIRGIMGFDKRSNKHDVAVPVTVMNRPLSDFVSHPYNVIAVFSKNEHDSFYDTLVGAISRRLLFDVFPDNIKRMIAPDLIKKLIDAQATPQSNNSLSPNSGSNQTENV